MLIIWQLFIWPLNFQLIIILNEVEVKMNYLAWTDKSLKSETEVNQRADEQKLLWQILLKGKWFFDNFF